MAIVPGTRSNPENANPVALAQKILAINGQGFEKSGDFESLRVDLVHQPGELRRKEVEFSLNV